MARTENMLDNKDYSFAYNMAVHSFNELMAAVSMIPNRHQRIVIMERIKEYAWYVNQREDVALKITKGDLCYDKS